jgi:hypothetical protein
METTKLKQDRMACYRRVLEKSRQEAMVDHFINRDISTFANHPK